MAAIDEVRAFLAEFLGPSDTPIAERIEKSAAFAQAAVLPDGVIVEVAERGGVAVEWVIPQGAGATPIFLHLHGGGYVMGDPAASRAFTTELASRTGARVLSVDYGLVYRSLLDVGVPPGALAIGGESAGGGLALALLIAARDAGLPMPACAVAMSPWSNLVCGHESYVSKAGADPLLTRGVLLEMAASYLAGADARHPWASPGLADLSGLPPLLIQVGSEEVLLGDAQELAERARAAGVEVELEVWDDMIHVWHMFHPMLPQGLGAIARVAAFVTGRWPQSVTTVTQ